MKRIAIVGSAGAGKSTLAGILGKALALPVYNLDSFFWNPGWIPTEDEKWAEIVEKLAGNTEWIIDGNYGRTMDIRFSEADMVIFLDFSTYICLFRIIKRYILNAGKTRPDMAKGCPERLDMGFIKWVWDFKKRSRPAVLKRLDELPEEKEIYIIKSQKQLNSFLKDRFSVKLT